MNDDDGLRLWLVGGKVHNFAGQPTTRYARIADAQTRGSHTDAEWRAIVRAANRECHHCGVQLCAFNGVRDHKVPLVRGGSDAAENLDYICWQCNTEKGMRTPDEWSYDGPRPRPFVPMPWKRAEWERLVARRGA